MAGEDTGDAGAGEVTPGDAAAVVPPPGATASGGGGDGDTPDPDAALFSAEQLRTLRTIEETQRIADWVAARNAAKPSGFREVWQSKETADKVLTALLTLAVSLLTFGVTQRFNERANAAVEARAEAAEARAKQAEGRANQEETRANWTKDQADVDETLKVVQFSMASDQNYRAVLQMFDALSKNEFARNRLLAVTKVHQGAAPPGQAPSLIVSQQAGNATRNIIVFKAAASTPQAALAAGTLPQIVYIQTYSQDVSAGAATIAKTALTTALVPVAGIEDVLIRHPDIAERLKQKGAIAVYYHHPGDKAAGQYAANVIQATFPGKAVTLKDLSGRPGAGSVGAGVIEVWFPADWRD